MAASMDRGLAFSRAEIARLNTVLATAPPHARRTALLRTTLKFHEETVARATGSAFIEPSQSALDTCEAVADRL